MTRKSSISLRFVVIGAGIAGLSCAYLLQQSGHEVVVLEKQSRRPENPDGGLKVPPNMARLLHLFPGTMEMLKEKARMCSGVYFHAGESSKLLGRMIFKEEIMSDLGSDFYMVAYSDFIAHLYDLCISSGVRIKHGFIAKNVVAPSGSPPVVVSESGVQITADVVVGAEGRNSITRQAVHSEDQESDDDLLEFHIPNGSNGATPKTELTRVLAASVTIPISLMKDDPQLAPLTRDDRFVVWTGNGSSVGTTCCGGKFVVTYNAHSSGPNDRDLEWDDPAPVSTFLERVQDYHPLVRKVARLAKSSHWTIQVPMDRSSFTNPQNNVVVIGDAAHTLPINTTHSCSAAMEDAVTFGYLFSHLKSRNQVPLFFNGYNHIRGDRTKQSEELEFDGISVVSVPPGPHRDTRDSALGMTLHLEGADDETLARVWGDYVRAFNYDAVDAVDEWYMNWAKPLHSTTNSAY
ncbi:hypothetical protein E1B28_005751 [Marasmius oreades]|uniref:FAD-binding domain-containing protein n=1 Tax=Marasmius oreades TaxID=181124 RepID=A0A9P7S452_9AGAR|nr:uncharacterized protein E1B28_005751 [Marasmius oreades]KAG7094950.1 hypothetical protein E1B28_005751 [Marasmius oreades]